MAVDTPAKIAVLGAGPIGLEAALYARFLGYDVSVYERGGVAENVLAWGHVRLFSPFGMNRSPLGLAALTAQDPGYRPPTDEALLTGREYARQYLLPLSKTDLLADNIFERTKVMAIGRTAALKAELVGDPGRAEFPFRLLVVGADGTERYDEADIVIDATGTYGKHCWMGQGGIPAIGERAAADQVVYRLPDILGDERNAYAGKHTLLVGAGYSAATSVAALDELARGVPGTRVTWVTRSAADAQEGPVPIVPHDRLAERDRIARIANALGGRENGVVRHFAGTSVAEIDKIEAEFRVRLAGQHAQQLEVDRVIANVGFRPETELYSQLQVHQCYATEGPIKLAATLIGQSSGDCLDQQAAGPDVLMTSEPNFYVLGSKSYGRDSRFLISIGLQQIRDLFTIIGDRKDLDLYAGAANLVS